MKKFLNNQNGVALIMSLLMTLVMLMFMTVMLYMARQGSVTSGHQKAYRTVQEATYAMPEIFGKDIIPLIFRYNAANSTALVDNINQYMDLSNLHIPDNNPDGKNCLQLKVTQPRSVWLAAGCSDSDNAKVNPDISFVLKSQLTGITQPPGFKVYAKIVDTSETGNTDKSGRRFEGASTTAGGDLLPSIPTLYRIEVTGERENNPQEKSNVSVLYAY
jgi:hypothetical protein